MRILFWVLIIGVYILIGNNLQVLAGLKVEKIGMDSTYAEEKGTTAALSSKLEGRWDWLRLDITDKFYFISPEDEYSSIRVGLNLPKLSENLDFSLNYSWNQSYYLQTTGIDYQKYFFDRFKLKLGTKYGLRNAVNGDNSKYRYSLEGQTMGLGYDSVSCDYDLELTKTVKDYPVTTYYSSEKLQLDQSVTWRINPLLKLELACQETSCDYPFDASLTRAYWKEKWLIEAEYQINELCRLTSKFSQTDWDQGFDHYRDDRRFEVDLRLKMTTSSELLVGMVFNDLDYYSSIDYSDPGDVVEEEDYKSRIELKFGIEYQYDFTKNLSLGLGSCFGQYDYKSAMVQDVNEFGFSGIITWKFKPYYLKIKAAPVGDLQRNGGYYQLKLEREL